MYCWLMLTTQPTQHTDNRSFRTVLTLAKDDQSAPSCYIYIGFSFSSQLTCFTSKVDNIRATTTNAPPANINRREVPLFTRFHGVKVEELCLLISKSSNKQCERDPISMSLVKELIDVLAPTIINMATRSLVRGNFLTHTNTSQNLRSCRLIRMT